MADKATLTLIKRQIERLDPALQRNENDDGYRVAVLLLAAVRVTGSEIEKLTEFTGYPREFVARVSERMRNSGVWDVSGTAHSDHWFQGDTPTTGAFWADVLVGMGLARAELLANFEVRYWAITETHTAH